MNKEDERERAKGISHREQPVEYIRYLLTLNKNKTEPEVTKQLSKALCYMFCRKNGLLHLINACLDLDDSSQKQTTHGQRFEGIATIVAGLPCLDRPIEQYFQSIVVQLILLIRQKECSYEKLSNEIRTNLKTLAVTILRSLLKRNRKVLIKNFLQPITKCVEQGQSQTLQVNFNQTAEEVNLICSNEAKETQSPTNETQSITINLNDSIEIVGLCLQRRFPAEHFVSCFKKLFFFKVLLHSTLSHLNSILYHILEELLSSTRHSCFLLDDTLFSANSEHILLQFEIDQSSSKEIGLKARDSFSTQSNDNEHSNKLKQIDAVCQIVSKLIRSFSIEQSIDLFLLFLQRLTNSRHWPADDSRMLLLCSLIDIQQEQIAPALTEHPMKAIQFINSTLERIEWNDLSALNSTETHEEEQAAQEKIAFDSLQMCLQLIESLLDIQMNSKEQSALCESLTTLTNLYQKCSQTNAELKSRLSNLNCRLMSKSIQNDRDLAQDQMYAQALKDLNSTLMPDRAHALIVIKKMIEQKNHNVFKNQDQILTVLKATLSDPESYIYLSSINTLSTLAIRKTDQVLPILIDEFNDEHRSIEERTRVGQCLVNLSRQLGDMAPAYAQPIMHSLLRNCRSTDALVRVSAISSLGEFCANLRFSLKAYIVELMMCLESLFKTDENVEVRRSCVMFFHLLFNKLGKEELVAAQELVLQIYRLLKQCYSTNLDEVIQLHAQLALEQLDRIAREFFSLPSPSSNTITLK